MGFINFCFYLIPEESNNFKNDEFDTRAGHDDSLDVVSLVGDDDGDDNNLADDDDVDSRSDVEFSTRKRHEKRDENDENDDDERKSASPRFPPNGFAQNSSQPAFGHPFAAALAAGGKAALDGLLPAQLPPSAFTPHEYLARYYQMMQQQGHSAAAALTAAVAASTAKIGSPGLHRSFENGIEQQSN
jgi:hypothetical protein